MGLRSISAAHDEGCAGSGDAVAPGTAGWLGLAAAPTFAVMAVWSAIPGGQPDMLCMGSPAALSLNGMAVMYALMSLFHAPPWIRVIRNRRTGAPLP